MFVNCDETSIPFTHTGRKGHVAKIDHGKANTVFERARLGDRRGSITYLAFIGSTPGVQRKLPQILVGNRHRFTAAALRDIAADKPQNIHFWRDTSAWMNHLKFKKALRLLNEAMAPREHQQLILVLDCARCHLRGDVVAYASRLNIWIVVVPSKLTFLLQPLDAYAFAPFKRSLVDTYYKARMRAGGNVLNTTGWLRVLVTSIVSVFQERDWAHTFAKVGVSEDQSALSSAIHRQLQSDGVLVFPRGQPTKEEVAYLGGKGFCMPHTQLMKPFHMHATQSQPEHLDTPPPPISSRTRSMSASSLPAAASSSSASPGPGSEWKTPRVVRLPRVRAMLKMQKDTLPDPPLPPPAAPPVIQPLEQSLQRRVVTRAMKRNAEQALDPQKHAKTQ